MVPVATNIALQTHRDDAALRFANVVKFDDGSGFRCDITARSGEFGCSGPFYFDDFFLKQAISAFQTMRGGIPGEAVLKGLHADNYIRFEMNKLGHVIVSGLLQENGGSTQSLKFEFLTD